jgi:GAF domain
MDHHSTVGHSSAPPAMEGDKPGANASRSATASVSAGIAAANAHLPKRKEPGPRFPSEDGGRSLTEMAHSDLDATLQLLVEGAQYITGATGAAIALRRGQRHDMLCRASAGSSAPELGALLSMEYGLSGESVRTRKALRCDDAQRDPRVNREGCRQLGIASVVVMPIVSDEQVLGVFELFSGKPCAFDERDLSALRRLSEMVETAVKHAAALPPLPLIQNPTGVGPQISAQTEAADCVVADLAAEPATKDSPSQPREAAPQKREKIEDPEPASSPKKPLFWTAAIQMPSSGGRGDAEPIPVPPVLRNLQKCQACGFPISQGRTFCVECEEKNWRGQTRPQAVDASVQAAAQTIEFASAEGSIPAQAVTVPATPRDPTSASAESAEVPAQSSVPSSSPVLDNAAELGADFPTSGNSDLFLSSAPPSESWIASNKYVLGVLLVVAIVIAAMVWLR